VKWLLLFWLYTGFGIVTGIGLLLKADLDFIYIAVMFTLSSFLISVYGIYRFLQERKKDSKKETDK
jgi:membrane protein implicated in regulation of membrane protease activity